MLSLLRSRKAEAGLLAFFSIWLLLTVLAPFAIPSGSVTDLTGVVGRSDNSDVIETMNPFAKVMYGIGDSYCHQIASRSYFLNGNQVPFCSRDVGIFAGLALGMAVAIFTRFRITVLAFLIGVLPLALDGTLQLVTSYESNNPVRFVTGILAGAAVSLLISLFVRELLESKGSSSAQTKESGNAPPEDPKTEED